MGLNKKIEKKYLKSEFPLELGDDRKFTENMQEFLSGRLHNSFHAGSPRAKVAL